MSSITSTTISSYDYLLRQCYSSNRTARKSYGRTTLKVSDLVLADSSALKKVSRNLKDIEYSSDNGVNIYNNVKAFAEAYNNLFESSDKLTSSAELTRAEKKLKNYVKENKDALEAIGIKVSSSGKLTVDKTTLLSSSASKLKKVFSEDTNIGGNITKLATRINRIAKTIMRSGDASTNQTVTSAETPPVTTAIMTANAIDFRA